MKQLKVFLLIATSLAILLAAVLWFVADTWLGFGKEGGISPNGLLALALGCALTFALGVGLMALVFYSNRSGHDALSQTPGAHATLADSDKAV